MGLEDPLMGGKLLKQAWRKVKSAPIVPASHEFVIRGLDPRISNPLSEMAGSSPAMTTPQSIQLRDAR
jgi:hypothetical protein